MEKQLESSETDKSQLSLSLKETKDNLERTRGELTSQQVRELERERERKRETERDRERQREKERERERKREEKREKEGERYHLKQLKGEKREIVCDCERKKDKTTRPRSN